MALLLLCCPILILLAFQWSRTALNRYRSTSGLIDSSEGDPYLSESYDELWSRYVAGEVEPEEANRMLQNSLEVNMPIVRSPHPANRDVLVRIDVSKKLGYHRGWRILATEHIVTCDGVEIDCCAGNRANKLLAWDGVTDHEFTIPALPLGPHELAFQARFELQTDPAASQPAVPYPTAEVACGATLNIEKKPLGDYVRRVWSDGIAAELKDSLRLSVAIPKYAGSPALEIALDSFEASAPIAGRFWVRTDPQGQYQATEGIGVRPSGMAYHYGRSWVRLPAGAVPTKIDVRLIGDAAFAFDTGLTQYFAGMIEWENVSVGASAAGGGASPPGVAPTRILPLE